MDPARPTELPAPRSRPRATARRPRPASPRLPLYPPRNLEGHAERICVTMSFPVLRALDELVRAGHGSRSDLIERCVEHFVGRSEASAEASAV